MKKKNPIIEKNLYAKSRLFLGGAFDDNHRGVMIRAYKIPYNVSDISKGASFRLCRTTKDKK